ncbi:MAG: RraA family protein [Planctomycetota bacterium]
MSEARPLAFAKLAQFDTPTVLNVIELLDVRPRDEGYTDATIKAVYPEQPPIVGYATTAKFRSSRPADDEPAYGGLGEQVESFVKKIPEPRIVVFEDADPSPVAATYGEVMCSIYQSFGCVGLITSGAARDIEQVKPLGFPCFASSAISSHGYCRIVDFDTDVTVGGLHIQPGDVIHADANGVAKIPTEYVDAVAEGCGLLVEAENEIIHYVRSGTPTLEGLAAARQRCADEIAKIRAQITRA